MKNSKDLKLFLCKYLLTFWTFIKPDRKVSVMEDLRKTTVVLVCGLYKGDKYSPKVHL